MADCTARTRRAAMTDDEFWDDVGRSLQPGGPSEPGPDDEDLDDVLVTGECQVCGALGECAVDDAGRPLIHAIPADEPT